MKTAPEIAAARFDVLSSARSAVFWLSLALLVAVPLAFSTAVHRIFSLPKFAILVVGSSALAALIGLIAVSRFANKSLRPLASRHALILCLYMVAVTVSTLFGVAPRVSLFGSFENQMGLITRLCFLICFSGLIVGIGHSQTRLRQTAWAMSVVGLVIATYAFLQFFGQDRLLDPALYTFDSAEGPTVRVMGTLGHANYLGNFLLYTTPLCAALSVVARSSARRIALLAVAVSVAAIVFSGTRGAALGLVAGAATFMALEFRASRISFNHRTVWRAAAAFIIILASVLTISFNPASRSIAARALTAIKEGASGAGRTLLWRDSVKMVPDFALIGCGPEGFRKAFLPYKSKEIAELAPGTNDESAHNSYLDAAISYGLPGAIFYAAIIASSLSLLIRARRRALNQSTRIISTGLLASLAAVAVHNIFIFDQIPTGLYFFALAALAQVALGVATAERRDEIVFAPKAAEAAPPRFLLRGTGIAVVIAGLAITALAAWYSIALVKADVEINKSFQSASAGDYESTLAHGHAAASSPEMTGAYNFQYARALVLYADRVQFSLNSSGYTENEIARIKAARADAIKLAIAQAEQSLAHTLTPDSSHLLLAYLALTSHDAAGLRAHATEALRWDQYYPGAHWLMAEAYLAEGDLGQAEREAAFALEINPNLREARSALRRARGQVESPKQTFEGLLARGRELAERGKTDRAQRKLLRAIKRARGPCPDCHRALALAHEAGSLYKKAIAEWRIFIEQSSDPAAIEEAKSRIESLERKASASH